MVVSHRVTFENALRCVGRVSDRRRLILVLPGAGADPAASGATRVSGSLNFKAKYAPAFPRVKMVHASPGMLVTRAQLEALGVVASQENRPVSDPNFARAPSRQGVAELSTLRRQCAAGKRRGPA
jgi:hypothetical protein